MARKYTCDWCGRDDLEETYTIRYYRQQIIGRFCKLVCIALWIAEGD